MKDLSKVVAIEETTIEVLKGLASVYSLTIEFFPNPKFEEEAVRSKKIVKLADVIDPEHF